MEAIKEGDKVRHKTLTNINGGLDFTVLEIDGDTAVCEVVDVYLLSKKEHFKVDDLILTEKS